MYGAYIGDVSGSFPEVIEINAVKNKTKVSYEERIKILNTNVPLFDKNSSYTDDSTLTCSISDALLNNKDYEFYIRKYGLREIDLGLDKYGRSRFGKYFAKWLISDFQGESYGNGSAMRVSPIGYFYDNLDDVIKEARLSALPSHNNEEAIKGAIAVAVSIYLARRGYTKEQIKQHIEKEYKYDLNFNLSDLQHNYVFSSRCINSVPQAIYCFLISNNFEDAIRKAISIGGDTDTIACITGSISEAFYGIDERLKQEVCKYLPDYIINTTNKFYDALEKKGIYGRTFKKNSGKIN